MITVALAGGTSKGLGRSIVNAIKQYPDQLKVVVLSRESSKVPEWLVGSDVEVRKVDYKDEESLYKGLQGIHTVVSVLLAVDGTAFTTHKNLINAALRAGVKRFAPAEFGVGALADKSVEILSPTVDIMNYIREVKQNNPDFEYAGFHNGLFMNYLGYGAKDEASATHDMNDTWIFIFDVKNMKARIPLTKNGQIPTMTMTEIGNVGEYVAAACLLPKGSWREDFMLAGDTQKLDDMVKIIESVRGRKMHVTYRQYEDIQKNIAKEETFYPNQMWNQLELEVSKNQVGRCIMKPTLNELCSTVKPLTLQNYMERFWN